MRRLVVAAPSSGSGKTTVATGLMAALRRRGHRVSPFKIGPDYIDPGYHTLASGRPGRNLDPVLVGEDRINPLFSQGTAGTDIAIVEGVMGMFDGRGSDSDFGSTAHLAKLLSAPVVLVVDASGQARSLGATVRGFRDFDVDVRLGGVIANRVGSPAHAKLLAEVCADVEVPMLGALPWTDTLALPSRHLGLVTAAEHGVAATDAVDAMGTLVDAYVDLDAVVRMAATGSALTSSPWEPAAHVTPVVDEPVIAVAGGPAFTFGYAEHHELLAAAGATFVVFDPLRDESLPAGTAGIVLPGGFPEQQTNALSDNEPLRTAIRRFAADGGPVHAECGGLLYLTRSLDGHPMCGVLATEAERTDQLRIGYRDALALTDSILGPAGTRVTGHEFHTTVTQPSDPASSAWQWQEAGNALAVDGFVQQRVHASYLHVHPAGYPALIDAFLQNSTIPST
ncbi:cobyrinate a,c-diamide synthase [Actinophytocola oryzae]|uniref:Hydrogenobyrinate a,c-diamide synthase n=1 Tax=Actinophytocola oryzae TaxID=502181 RepID=A0A4R7V482_9PSEU|nr:cobyrinate a,c-diamide synthase [Actinophytocola oryzae]TDV43720.1 cobyrinic acid a,c-diamide synthase [Actinophytocola oryzae]